jgi:hypothetical protein
VDSDGIAAFSRAFLYGTLGARVKVGGIAKLANGLWMSLWLANC